MVKFITHATTLSQQWSISPSLSLCLSASLLSPHPFPFHIKDVHAQEKGSLNKRFLMNVVLIYTGSYTKNAFIRIVEVSGETL
jgi:hypothetical protein